jgi:transposase
MAHQSSSSIALDIPGMRIISARLTREQQLILEVESTFAKVNCDQCGRPIADFDGYDPPRKLRYLHPAGRLLYLSFRPRRFRCPYCSHHPITLQQIASPDPETQARELGR